MGIWRSGSFRWTKKREKKRKRSKKLTWSVKLSDIKDQNSREWRPYFILCLFLQWIQSLSCTYKPVYCKASFISCLSFLSSSSTSLFFFLSFFLPLSFFFFSSGSCCRCKNKAQCWVTSCWPRDRCPFWFNCFFFLFFVFSIRSSASLFGSDALRFFFCPSFLFVLFIL